MPQPAILCDIGNVLVTFDFSIAARRFAAHSSHSEDTVLQALHSLKEPLEDGLLADADFVSQGMQTIDFQGSSEEFIHIWCDIFAPNVPMIATVQALASTVPLHLLSNTSGLHKDHLFATYPVFSHFKSGIYSYAAQCSKPSPKIFHHTLADLDLDPAQTFFIDDLAANIATARDLGFITHQYDHRQHQQLEAELQTWLQSHKLA